MSDAMNLWLKENWAKIPANGIVCDGTVLLYH